MQPAFVDPRTKPTPPWTGPLREPAATVDEVRPLIDSLRSGHLYDAEAWIAGGDPLQFRYSADKRRSPTSPLQEAIWSGGHDAVLLLLCNGYRLELERRSPLTQAFNAGSLDVVRLLLTWGADPHDVDPNQVVSCYDAATIEEFWRRGLDFSEDNALAGALAYETSNKPLYGFMKRNAPEDPSLQRELDRGLSFVLDRHFGEEGRSIEKAVQLCIWAGADPWSQVHVPFEPAEGSSESAEWCVNDCGAGRAVLNGRVDVLPSLKLRAGDAHFQALYPPTVPG